MKKVVEIKKDIAKESETEAAKAYQKQRALLEQREYRADEKFEAYRFDKECVEIVDHEHWEEDGPDRFIKKIYWTATDEEWDTSKLGSFIVQFRPGSTKIAEVYPNL